MTPCEQAENKGTCVLVDGRVVAWFADWNHAAREWCTENYFGTWLTLPAVEPEVVPIPPEEIERLRKHADELLIKLRKAGKL